MPIKAEELIHLKSANSYEGICGKPTFYFTRALWKVTCPDCKEQIKKLKLTQ